MRQSASVFCGQVFLGFWIRDGAAGSALLSIWDTSEAQTGNPPAIQVLDVIRIPRPVGGQRFTCYQLTHLVH